MRGPFAFSGHRRAARRVVQGDHHRGIAHRMQIVAAAGRDRPGDPRQGKRLIADIRHPADLPEEESSSAPCAKPVTVPAPRPGRTTRSVASISPAATPAVKPLPQPFDIGAAKVPLSCQRATAS